MSSDRPLLIPSPQPLPTLHFKMEDGDPSSRRSIMSSKSRRDSINARDAPNSFLTATDTLSHSSSSAKPPVRYGSRGTDGFSSSLREIKDEDARIIYVNHPDQTNFKFDFAGNSIQTGKYSVLTFLPRNLFEQFHRVAYIYFLVIAILNQLPQLAMFGRGASVAPLAIVLLVTAVKDAYEDWRRHKSDRIENNRVASVLVNGSFQSKKWKDIRVGEVLKISANDTLPCDMVLLSTSDPY